MKYYVSVTWSRWIVLGKDSGRSETTHTGSQGFDDLTEAFAWVLQTVPDGCTVEQVDVHGSR